MDADIRNLLGPWTPGCFSPALAALRSIPAGSAAGELRNLARDETPNVRAFSILLAHELRLDVGDEVALALLADPVGFVRYRVCEHALRRTLDPAAGPIARLLASEPDELVRAAAVTALPDTGDRSHLPFLEAALEVETGTDHQDQPVSSHMRKAIESVCVRYPITY